MTIKTRSLLLGTCVAALCGLSQTASAHPGWVTTAVGSATASSYTSQFNAITVGHGIKLGCV